MDFATPQPVAQSAKVVFPTSSSTPSASPSLSPASSSFSPTNPTTTLTRAQLADKIKGLLYGAALGDAIGLSTEFLSKQAAATHYRHGPILFGQSPGYPFVYDRHRRAWAVGDFTDDTDQQLVLAASLLATAGTLDTSDFARRLRSWAEHGIPEAQKPPYGIGATVGRVLSHNRYLAAPVQAAFEVWATVGRCNLAANGAVMRTAVAGVPFFWDEQKVLHNALAAARVTHADPRCLVSCAVVSLLVARMLQGYPPVLDFYAAAGDGTLDPHPRNLDLATQTDRALLRAHMPPAATDLASLSLADGRAIGYTYKCLGAAVHCFLRNLDGGQGEGGGEDLTPLFKRVVTELALEAGDADTNAAVAGALLGCRVGFAELPRDWVDALRGKELLDRAVEGLCGLLM
ncbi:ADP-ribosylation/Crystallin J1 [Zopfochytrium polystomum]|nr:ADP-ribosylation/Crystallin J1 [Zopfochytrium polystomum]